MKSLSPNLMVYNVNDTIDYYKTYFNFNEVKTVPDEGDYQWAMLQNGSVTIMLQSIDSLKNELPYFEDIEPGGGFTLFIQVEGIEKLYDELKDNLEILAELNKTNYGINEFTIRDLNGYIITFAEAVEK